MKQPKISIIVIFKNEQNPEKLLNSLIKQSFTDIEIICANNIQDEKIQNIIQEIAAQDERIKLINLPLLSDDTALKQACLSIAGGDFICFINQDFLPSSDFIKNLYSPVSCKKLELKENHLYRRTFLENDEELSELIENSVKFELNKSEDTLNKQKNAIKEEFNKFYQINNETIKNSIYEVTCRFNQLEKLFYEKDFQNNNQIKDLIESLNEKSEKTNKQIYNDISKIYDYINSEINKKGCEINNLYEEITKNYHYTEKLTEDKLIEFSKTIGISKDFVQTKLDELEKEMSFRYSSIKHILDNSIDEIKSDADTFPLSSSKFLSDNIDKVYSRINDMSSLFYKELSCIYKKMNEKLINENEKNIYTTEVKISELRNEFNSKIQELKEKLNNK